MKNKGFTLIEMLLVIMVIGILSVITAGTFRAFLDNTHDTKKTALSSNVMKAITAISTDIGNSDYSAALTPPYQLLDELSRDSFTYSVLSSECLWVGINSANTSEMTLAFLQLSNGTLKLIKNGTFDITPTLPASSCAPPVLTGWNFWSIDAQARICDDTTPTPCCAFYTGTTQDSSNCS